MTVCVTSAPRWTALCCWWQWDYREEEQEIIKHWYERIISAQWHNKWLLNLNCDQLSDSVQIHSHIASTKGSQLCLKKGSPNKAMQNLRIYKKTTQKQAAGLFYSKALSEIEISLSFSVITWLLSLLKGAVPAPLCWLRTCFPQAVLYRRLWVFFSLSLSCCTGPGTHVCV